MRKSQKLLSSLAIITILLMSRVLIFYSDMQDNPDEQSTFPLTYAQAIKQHTYTIYSRKVPFSDSLSDQDRTPIGQGLLFPDKGIILTNRHVTTQNQNNYAIKLGDTMEEIIDIASHPEQDLSVGTLLTGTQSPAVKLILSTNLLQPGTTVQYRHNQVRKQCLVTTRTPEGLLATDCRFHQGQSGHPVFTSSGSIAGLITATDNAVGYILPITETTIQTIIDIQSH